MNNIRNKSILIVEDESELADLIALHLRDFGASVSIAADGNSGLKLALSQTWDLIILDIQLPGPSGLDICRQLRERGLSTAALMLTARSSEPDRIFGLEIGADDYLTKPFSIMELIARIKAMFRRIDLLTGDRSTQQDTQIKIGALTISEDNRQVILDNKPVELTLKEFDLLIYFAKHPGRVFRRAELLARVWGYGHDGYEHTVNSHINRLRAKIEQDPSNPEYVVTVWGVGYKMNSDLRASQS